MVYLCGGLCPRHGEPPTVRRVSSDPGRPTRDDRRETLRRKTVRHETSTAQLRRRRRDRRRLPRLRAHRHPLPAAARRHQGARLGHAGHARPAVPRLALAARLERRAGHGGRAGARGAALSLDRHHDAPYLRLGADSRATRHPGTRRAAGRPRGAPCRRRCRRRPCRRQPLPEPPPAATRPTGPTPPDAATSAASPGGAFWRARPPVSASPCWAAVCSRAWAPPRPTPSRGRTARAAGVERRRDPERFGHDLPERRRLGTVERRHDRQRRRRGAVKRRLDEQPGATGSARRAPAAARPVPAAPRRAARPQPPW